MMGNGLPDRSISAEPRVGSFQMARDPWKYVPRDPNTGRFIPDEPSRREPSAGRSDRTPNSNYGSDSAIDSGTQRWWVTPVRLFGWIFCFVLMLLAFNSDISGCMCLAALVPWGWFIVDRLLAAPG